MFGSSFHIATIRGIPIKAHASLIILLLWITFQWGFGLIESIFVAASLLMSIVLHELGHSLVAISKGCRVRRITLMALGGQAQMEQIPTKPADEFLMAIAGPAVSIVLGLSCKYGGHFLPLPKNTPLGGGVIVNTVQFLGYINICLAIFNMIPCFPMDGGRILRSLLVPKFGMLKATYLASRVGRVICIFGGIYAVTYSLWFLLAIAFFIYIAGNKEYQMVRMQEARGSNGPDQWAPPQSWDPTEDDDEVTISPPPFNDEPEQHSKLHSEDKDDF